MKHSLYPLKFQPILKERIWGGQKLKTILNKNTTLTNIGESWELSDIPGDTSIVSNGNFNGQSLKELIETYKQDLV
jgi:mannose-6-phosphate isomerase